MYRISLISTPALLISSMLGLVSVNTFATQDDYPFNDQTSPLTDQSRSLEAILEYGNLSEDDCTFYFAGQTDRETKLRCGKWMFFYGHLEVPGSPAELVDLLRDNAPNTFGRSLEHLGLHPDPYSEQEFPVGMAAGPMMPGNVSTYTLTCAACHFGKTTDGRFVVGSPNNQFQFGKFTLSVSSLPEVAIHFNKTYSPEIESVLRPVTDEVFSGIFNRLRVLREAIRLLPNLIVTQATPPDDDAKQYLALYPSGVMDPYAAPALDDGARVPVRMSPLWGIDPEGMTEAGSEHGAMLGSNGGAPNLSYILRTFSVIAGHIRKVDVSEHYTAEKIAPIIEYIMSLEPPKTEKSLDVVQVQRGKELFYSNCLSCHNGPGYAGTQVFDPLAIGVDPNVIDVVDPERTGRAVHDVITPKEITRGLRARRLSGVWSMTRLFHNGSIDSLEEVFCLNGPRKENTLGSGFSTAGHMYTCDLTREEKLDLITFIESI